MKKNKTLPILFKILSINKRYFFWYCLLVLASILISVFGVVWSEAFRRMVNGATSYRIEAIYEGFVLAVSVFFLDSLTQLLSSYLGTRLDNIAAIQIQNQAVDKLLHTNLAEVLGKDSNYFISVINQFIPEMQQTINKKARQLLGLIVTFIVTIIYLLNIDLGLTFGVLIISIVLPLFTNLFSKYVSNQHTELKDKALKRDCFYQDIIQAPIEIRQFKLEKFFLNKLKRMNDDLVEKGHQIFCVENAINRINVVSNYLCIIFILAYGGYRVYLGYIELGDIVAFLYSSVRIFNPLPTIVSVWVSIQSTLSKAQDVFQLLDFNAEETMSLKKINLCDNLCDIIIKNIEFSYESKKVLNNVSAEIYSGEINVIVGANGVGKSTLVKILLGLYSPESGEIYFNEYNLNQINTRALISYVPQKPYVFSASIKDNILLGDDTITEDALYSAVKDAALQEFLTEHKGGIDYILNENGSNISGGELQRICIARALVRDKPILILDEHTSNVDGINEEAIFNVLKNISKKKTIIIIAHKLETMKRADKILYMSEGTIKESGDFNELMINGREFSTFIKKHQVLKG